MPQHPSYQLGQLWLSHEPEHPPDHSIQKAGLLNICGHIHPVATLSFGGDRLRLPCFAYDATEERLLIPSFGELTGGHECGQLDRKWLVAEGTIVPWQNPESRARKGSWSGDSTSDVRFCCRHLLSEKET